MRGTDRRRGSTGAAGRLPRRLGPAITTVLAVVVTACGTPWGSGATPAPEGGRPPAASAEEEPDAVPTGHGTLRQDQVTLSLRRGDLLVKVTPLAEGVIRVTAPDTYQRLRGLKERHRDELARRSRVGEPSLFLVSFFSYEADVPFEPEDVHLLNRGLRYRPRAARGLTPGWGAQRLGQEETQMAILAYARALDLDQDLVLEYRDARAGGWDRILRTVQAERARAIARARSGG